MGVGGYEGRGKLQAGVAAPVCGAGLLVAGHHTHGSSRCVNFKLPPQMSCLFRALGQQLGVGEGGVRAAVADWLSGDPLLDGTPASHYTTVSAGWPQPRPAATTRGATALAHAAYCRRMRSAATWGGGPEMAAAAAVYGVRIVVRRVGAVAPPAGAPPQRALMEVLPAGTAAGAAVAALPTARIWWNGGHFEPDGPPGAAAAADGPKH